MPKWSGCHKVVDVVVQIGSFLKAPPASWLPLLSPLHALAWLNAEGGVSESSLPLVSDNRIYSRSAVAEVCTWRLRIIPMTLLSASPSSSSQDQGNSGWLNALEEEYTP